ncbi:MAG: SDR family oxidoreductase [Sphingomonadaceae bacterium]|nr:SDR family oxidoreductase [Sphingomonadaceae bacterium]
MTDQGQVAIVTGGASGIGAATSKWLATEGYHVVIADINGEGAMALAAQLREHGAAATATITDMSDERSVIEMVATAAQAGLIAVLVNNAADLSQIPLDGNVTDTELSVWDRVYAVSVRGAVIACREAIPHMIAGGTGSVVNISSIQSLLGDHERAAYSAMKSAVNSLTRSIATRYGKKGVRCNTICPGPVQPDEPERAWPEPMKAAYDPHLLRNAVGSASELAEIVGFLASSRSALITGQIVTADAGFSAHMHLFMKLRDQPIP